MKKMLIFGGAGSLGNELVKFYIKKYKIIIVSRDEAKHWELINKWKEYSNITTIIGDVRDADKIEKILLQEKPDLIIMAHALKQVDVCEKFPDESIKTNINGTINIINILNKLSLAKLYYPKTVCFVSTDKACNPINIYGMCKSIAEKYIINISKDIKNTNFVIVRYGNVLCSKGSIIPLLTNQVKNNKHFTLTNENMTRFMMTLKESVKLIDTALKYGKGGDIWVPKLSSMKILDLIKYFSKKYKKPYKIVGIRPGEKIHEVMLSFEETLHTIFKYNYFIYNKNNKINKNAKEYSSANHTLNYKDLEKFLDSFII